MKTFRQAIIPVAVVLMSGALHIQAAEPVTVEDFVRAESDHMIRANMQMVGAGIGEFVHLREPTTPDNQPVTRMYQPRKEILDGEWTFPSIEPVQ